MEHPVINVLEIDDNPSDARRIQELLSESRDVCFQVECVERLSEGLERLDNSGIDVVLVDLGLPDSQGMDTFHGANAHSPTLPIVVLAELDDESLAVQSVQQGAQDNLVKVELERNVLARALRYAIERNSKPIRARELRDAIQRVTMDSDEGTAEGPLAVPNPGGVSHAVES